MNNPFSAAYLTTAGNVFGPFAWIFFLLQVAGVGAGLYLMFMYQERDPLRKSFIRQLSITLLVAGGIGTLLGLLRLANASVFAQRFWFYLQLVIELGIVGYVLYYLQAVYPALVAQAQARRGPTKRSSARIAAASSNVATEPAPARPVATTGRREARRDRKRKSK